MIPVGLVVALGKTLLSAAKKSGERDGMEAAQASHDANKIDARAVVEHLRRARTLQQQGMLTEAEFRGEKQKVFYEIAMKPVAQGTQDFLLELAPLLQEGVLTVEEMQKMKKCLEAKFA